MPSRLADGLDVDADGDAAQRPLLATVPGRHLDLVLLLPVVAQLLRVPDIPWCIRGDFVQALLLCPRSEQQLMIFVEKGSRFNQPGGIRRLYKAIKRL